VAFDLDDDREPFSLFDDGEEPPVRQREPKSKGGRPRKPKWQKIRDEIRPDVEQYVGIVSMLFVPVSPTAADFNASRIDKTLDDTARLCDQYPWLLDALKKGSQWTALIGLFELAVGLVLCVMIDREMIDPNFVVAQILHVSDSYERTHGPNSASDEREERYEPPSILAGVAAGNP
jgi:hypothetical protein